jgi:hypothetical protein
MVSITLKQHMKDLARSIGEHGEESSHECTLYEPIAEILNYLSLITRTDLRFLTVAPQYQFQRKFADGTPSSSISISRIAHACGQSKWNNGALKPLMLQL